MARKKIKIQKHILIPQHKKISKNDKEDLLKNYNITKQQLPGIKVTDAAITELKAEVGDVIQIIRQSKTADMTVFYRVVMNE